MSKEIITSIERLTPDILNENSLEHLHRYAIAADLAQGKIVLDIACGEGYGTSLLAKRALKVTGIDINENIINEANIKYRANNIQFLVGDIYNIPVYNQYFDLLVCLETIEHVEDHLKVMNQIKKVLKEDGILLISTPNKAEYSEKTNYINPHHKKELNYYDLYQLLKLNFTNVQIFNQNISYTSLIKTDEKECLTLYNGNFQLIVKNAQLEPVYFLAIATNGIIPKINNSIFWGDKILQQAITAHEKMITSTITYRIGHWLLYPLKLIRNKFRKY